MAEVRLIPCGYKPCLPMGSPFMLSCRRGCMGWPDTDVGLLEPEGDALLQVARSQTTTTMANE